MQPRRYTPYELTQTRPAAPDVTTLPPVKIVESWLAERTVVDGKQVYTSILFSDYSRYCEGLKVKPLPLCEFGTALHLFAIERKRTKHGSLLTLALQTPPAKIQQTQAERSRQRAGLRRLFQR